jgi:quercetin dioxygenase-like cupin family protein
MNLVRGDSLGGVLITRIPPGKQVYPHIDGGWHAKTYDKFALQIAAHPQQAFCYEDGQYVTAAGDLFWFHNQESHWVLNESPCDRITMIVCVKLDKPFGGL